MARLVLNLIASAAIFYFVGCGRAIPTGQKVTSQTSSSVSQREQQTQAAKLLLDRKPASALRILEALAKEHPNPMVLRNLAIADLMSNVYRVNATQPLTSDFAWWDHLSKRGDALPLFLVSEHHARINKGDSALAVLRKAISLHSGNVKLWYALYRNAEVLEDHSLARLAIEKAYELAPDNLVLNLNWLTICAVQSDTQTVRQIVARLPDRIDDHNADAYRSCRKIVLASDTDSEEISVRGFAIANIFRAQVRPFHYAELAYDLQSLIHIPPPLPETSVANRSEVRVSFGTPIEIPLKFLRHCIAQDIDGDGNLELCFLRDDQLGVVRFKDTSLIRRSVDTIVKHVSLTTVKRLMAADFLYGFGPRRIASHYDYSADYVVWGSGGVAFVQNRELATEEKITWISERPCQDVTVADFDCDGRLDLAIATQNEVGVFSGHFNWKATDFLPRASIRLPAQREQLHSLNVLRPETSHKIDMLAVFRKGQQHFVIRQPHSWQFELSTVLCEAKDDICSIQCLERPKEMVVVTRTGTHRWLLPMETKLIDGHSILGLVTADVDNDGSLDLVTWNDQSVFIRTAESSSGFQVTARVDVKRTIIDCSCYDLNSDGLLDLVVTTRDGIRVYCQNSPPHNSWTSIQLLGSIDNIRAVNRLGIGSRIEVTTQGGTRNWWGASTSTHIGLGSTRQIHSVRVHWSDGNTTTILQPPINESLIIVLYPRECALARKILTRSPTPSNRVTE